MNSKDDSPDETGWSARGPATTMVLLATALAVLYAVRSGLGLPFSGGAWVTIKGLSVVLLALVCLAGGRRLSRSRTLVVGVALLLHSIGDVLIARGALLDAMAFFFFGHLGYIVAFVRARDEATPGVGPGSGRIGLALALLGWGAWMVVRLMPAMSAPFTIAIPIYGAALAGMACCAILIARADALTSVAAVLYVYSDSVIAWDRFLELAPQVQFLGWTTWPTYFVAQLLFTRWALRGGALTH